MIMVPPRKVYLDISEATYMDGAIGGFYLIPFTGAMVMIILCYILMGLQEYTLSELRSTKQVACDKNNTCYLYVTNPSKIELPVMKVQ